MGQLRSFTNISLDGYFTDAHGDMSWAHKRDAEWNKFSGENAGSGGTLLFGRKTYEMMKHFWPSPEAAKMNPEIARGMNRARKIVFSRTLGEQSWENTRVVKGDLAREAKKLKEETDGDLVILGSGSIVSQLTEAGLIDEFTVVVSPIVLGSGKPLFEGVTRRVALERIEVRSFENGNLVVRYRPG